MNSIPQKRKFLKQLNKAVTLPNPHRSYEELQEVINPGQDLQDANILDLRQALQAAEMALMVNDGNSILYIDKLGNIITVRTYLLKRIAAIRRLRKEVAG